MDLSWVFAAARRRWKALLVLFLLGPVAAAAHLAVTPVQYRATTTAIFAVDGAKTVRELVDGGTYVQQVVPSYTQIANSPSVLEPVIASLGLPGTAADLTKRVSVDTRAGELLARVSAQADTAEQSAALANAVAKQLGIRVSQLSRGSESASLPISLTIVSPATVPAAPFAPNYLRDGVLGLLGGLLLAGVYLYLREAVSGTMRTRADVAEVTDVPVLGSVVRDPRAKRRRLPLDSHPHVPRSESFWMLRNGVLPRVGKDAVVVAVVSARRGEGRTSVAANLAVAVAHAGKRVLLIDGDLRGRNLAPVFGLGHERGVASVLTGAHTFDEVVQHWAPTSLRGRGLDVVAADPTAEDATVLIASPLLTRLLDDASRSYDLVLVDTPALLDGTSGTLLAAQSDAVLVVVDADATGGRDLGEVMHRLGSVAPVLGIVLNKVSAQARRGAGRRTGRDTGRESTKDRTRGTVPTGAAQAGPDGAPVAAGASGPGGQGRSAGQAQPGARSRPGHPGGAQARQQRPSQGRPGQPGGSPGRSGQAGPAQGRRGQPGPSQGPSQGRPDRASDRTARPDQPHPGRGAVPAGSSASSGPERNGRPAGPPPGGRDRGPVAGPSLDRDAGLGPGAPEGAGSGGRRRQPMPWTPPGRSLQEEAAVPPAFRGPGHQTTVAPAAASAPTAPVTLDGIQLSEIRRRALELRAGGVQLATDLPDEPDDRRDEKA